MDQDERRSLAGEINRRCLLEGEFTLRSGRTATHYFDKYQFETDPVILDRVCTAMAELVPPGIDVLAGLELGGIPIVTGISRITGIPATFVRKRAKEYGTARLAEGTPVAGKQLLIIEDVVTSGGQIVLSTADLRGLGATVDHAMCVIDRGEGGRDSLSEIGLGLTALFTGDELTAAG